jgi:hypothetical protein
MLLAFAIFFLVVAFFSFGGLVVVLSAGVGLTIVGRLMRWWSKR